MDWTMVLVLAVAIAAFVLLKQLGQVGSEAARRYLQQGAKLIDVRSPGEFRSGHVPGAINIPLGDLQEAIGRHVPNREEVLLLHCLSGGRSAMAVRVLKGLGYRKAFNVGSYRRAEAIVRKAGGQSAS